MNNIKQRLADWTAPASSFNHNDKEFLREVLKRIEELEDLDSTFELRHKADIRAIKQWREGHPERELKMPDHADLVCWLIDELDVYKQTLANSVGEEISVLQLQAQLREREADCAAMRELLITIRQQVFPGSDIPAKYTVWMHHALSTTAGRELLERLQAVEKALYEIAALKEGAGPAAGAWAIAMGALKQLHPASQPKEAQ